MKKTTTITVAASIKAPIAKAWDYWTKPEHITEWNNASADWHTPHAENDLQPGGKFRSRMEAKDGSTGFEFSGVYNTVKEHQLITYTIDDGRKVSIEFSGKGNETQVTETFEAEDVNPIEMQQSGWQAILNNFKKYTENN